MKKLAIFFSSLVLVQISFSAEKPSYGTAAENGGIATSGPRTGKWELYDTSIDPGETRDLAAERSEKVAALVSQFEAWAKRVGVVPREEIVKLVPATGHQP